MADIRDAFPSKYLKASDLQGRAVNVVIDRVDFEAVGHGKEMKPILYFTGKEKGLVLNKTNCNKIMGIAQSPDTDEWSNISIQLYPSETSFQGEQVDCIRVRPVPRNGTPARQMAPPPPPPPPPQDDFVGGDMTDDDIPF